MTVVEDELIIQNVNEVYVKIYCSEGIAYELHSYFEFMVPGAQFSPQYRAKLWNGKIYLFSLKTREIYRGLIPYIIKFCEERKYLYRYDNEIYDEEFSLVEANEIIKKMNMPNIEPRDYQLDAFVHAIRSRRALLLSPTASGKSLIIYMIIRYLLSQDCKKVLIIVPTTSLVSQLFKDFKDYGFDSDTFVHKVFSGQEKVSNKPIIISTWQSLYTQAPSFFKNFDVIIGDEAHLFKAKSLATIMTALINAKYRIGTTGTLDGTKTHKLVLEGLFGQVRKVTTTAELMEQKVVADFNIKCLLLKHSDSLCQAAKNFTYAQEMEYLVLNESRNNFISNLAISLEGNTLILYQYVDKHGKILHEMISKKVEDRKVLFVSGDTDVEVRESIRAIVETEKDAIIIASYGTFSTGINIKNLHSIIFASPSKSRVRNLQSIGRGLRKSETKDAATLFDIADDLRHKKHENFTLKHFAERIKIYSEEKFVFKIYKIELKG